MLTLGLMAGASSAAVAATTTANVWVVPTGGGSSCTRVASPVDFASAPASAKCATVQAAVSAMSGGDRALVRSGTYANLNLSSVTKSPAVTVAIEPGGTATLTGGGSYTGVNGVTLDGTQGANGQGWDTTDGFSIGSNGGAAVQNFRLSGALIHDGTGGQMIWMVGCNNVTLSDIEIRNISNADGIQMAKYTNQAECSNVTFDGIYMHDFNATCGVDHQDGIQIRAGSNITFTNSRIFKLNNCGSQGFFANQEGDLGGSNTTLSNTVIAGINGNAINFSSKPPQRMINNTIDGGLNTCQPVTTTCNGVIMKNNILNSACAGQKLFHDRVQNTADWANNVSTSNCGYGAQGDTVTSNFAGMFVASGSPSYDYHLKVGAFAIGKATTAEFTASDIDRLARDSAPDAGADEYGNSTSTPPPADTTAPNTTISASPTSPTASTSASFSFSGSDDTTAAASLTFECSLDGAVFSACTSPKAYSGLSVGDHTFAVRAKDAAGNVDGSPATQAWTITSPAPVDTTAPDTTITSAPSGSTTSTSASVAFTGTDNVTAAGSLTFECQLDAGSWSACTSPKAYSGLAVGSHTVAVRAKDAAGNVDASPAGATWTIATAPPADTTAPETTITSSPQDGTTDTTASFAFAGSDDTTAAGSLTFQCQLDAGAWATCASPKAYTGLVAGSHSFAVRARDAAGNVDGTPATTTWTILVPDTVAPDTTITAQPDALSTSSSASFSFTGADDRTAVGGLRFECSLDGAAWTACTSPAGYDGLALLDHTFAVRAVDAAGNVDASPATVSWTVLAPTPPSPDPAPAPTPAPTPAPSVTAVYIATPTAGATFNKSLYMAAAATPAPGTTIKRVEFWLDGTRIVKDTAAPYQSTWSVPSRLKSGNHTLSARAYDAAGAVASTAVTVVRSTTATAATATAAKTKVRRSTTRASASLSSLPAADGGTDLVGAARAATVTATLAPCDDATAKAARKVTMRAVDGNRLSGHQRGRLCVVGLAPAAA
jgi:hypothetical protein